MDCSHIHQCECYKKNYYNTNTLIKNTGNKVNSVMLYLTNKVDNAVNTTYDPKVVIDVFKNMSTNQWLILLFVLCVILNMCRSKISSNYVPNDVETSNYYY